MADEGQVSQQIDQVEAVRSALNKTRTLMLLRMRHVLTPEQRVQLNALRDRREREQREREKQRQSQSSDGNKRPDDSRNRPN
jgi:Spy/CpxP family protein refolding chaperone